MALYELLTKAANSAEKHHEAELHKKLIAARKEYFRVKSKDEMAEIMRKMESAIGELNYPSSLYVTRTLCRCFISSILDMIRAAYATIELHQMTAFCILARSVADI